MCEIDKSRFRNTQKKFTLHLLAKQPAASILCLAVVYICMLCPTIYRYYCSLLLKYWNFFFARIEEMNDFSCPAGIACIQLLLTYTYI